MTDLIHDSSRSRSTVPDSYDADFILAEAGSPNHSGSMDNGDGTKLIVYHPNDHDEVVAVIDNYDALFLEKKAKPAKWQEVKALRSVKEALPAPTPFGPVQTDDASKIKILGIVQMAILALQAQQPFEAEFTMADNTVVMLDAMMAIGMGKASGQYISSVFAHARTLRAEIFAAESLEDLEAIDLIAGW